MNKALPVTKSESYRTFGLDEEIASLVRDLKPGDQGKVSLEGKDLASIQRKLDHASRNILGYRIKIAVRTDRKFLLFQITDQPALPLGRQGPFRFERGLKKQKLEVTVNEDGTVESVKREGANESRS